jgi:hypothetical protein
MKLTKLMVAIVTAGAGVSAFAASAGGPGAARVLNISGASATKGNLALSLNSLCTAAGGSMREWISGGNISSYVCFNNAAKAAAISSGPANGGAVDRYAETGAADFVDFQGTGKAEVNLNVAGGSFTAYLTLAGTQDTYIDLAQGTVAVGGLVNAGVTGGLGVAGTGRGGFMDVAPDCFTPEVLGIAATSPTFTTTPQGFAQAFGVAVSDALYKAMYAKQRNPTAGGGVTVDFPIANSCPAANGANEVANATTTRQECVPTISKADFAAVINNNEFSAPKSQGAAYFGAPAATELRYVRRVDTSGTQASVQNYFLGLPGLASNPLAIISDPNDTVNAVFPAVSGPGALDDEAGGLKDSGYDPTFSGTPTFRVLSAPGTGDVRTELNKAALYSIGVMSGENDQSGTWRWIRVNEATMAENANTAQAAPNANTNRAGLRSGRYDFFFEGVAVHPAGDQAFWNTVIAQLDTQALKGLVPVNGTTMAYNRNGSCKTPSSHN